VTAAPPLALPHVDGVEHRFELIEGARLHIAEAGSGPPLFLLHGWPQHWYCWRELIGTLSEHFTVVCPDLRGLGWSEDAGSDWSFAQLRADLLGILDLYGVERARIVGHDWGAAVGFATAFEHPDRVERFMPLAGLHFWAAIGSGLRLWARPWHIYASAVAGPMTNAVFGVPENSLRAWRRRGRFSRAEMEIYTGPMRMRPAVRATTLYYRNLLVREIPWLLRHARGLRLTVPTWHVNGAHDPLTRWMGDAWRTFADDLHFELVEECGHFIAEEAPEQLLDRMLRFFRGRGPTP
jgi:pimeloyl-ACP methyl ester carboxylesterase